MKLKRMIGIIFLTGAGVTYATAQKQKFDSAYIQKFEKENVAELYPGIYRSSFLFKSPKEKTGFRLLANSSAYIGTYFEYKWLALNFSTAIPETQLDRNIRLRYNSLNLRFGTPSFMFKPFLNSYNGLLIPENKRDREFLLFKNIQIVNAGTDVLYYINHQSFSYSASCFFSKQQIKSAGSFIAGVTPLWQQINWTTPSRQLIEDSTTYTLLASQPQWLSLTARFGYTYNFVFNKGKWSIAPVVLLGMGGLHEIQTNRKRFQTITDIQATINAGYNGTHYYFIATAWWDNLKTNLFVKDMDQHNTDISFTVGYRFGNVNRKILGIL